MEEKRKGGEDKGCVKEKVHEKNETRVEREGKKTINFFLKKLDFRIDILLEFVSKN